MPAKRRSFQRPLGNRRYKKLFVVAVEGQKTEYEYLKLVESHCYSYVKLEILRPVHSSPLHILQILERYIKEYGLIESDEAWVVMDKDEWPEEQINKIFYWTCQKSNYSLALSNPSFEYWLLLHFEEGSKITNTQSAVNRLKKHLTEYDKGIDSRKISKEMIESAIKRAEFRDKPACKDWPRSCGNTTVYRLIRKIYQVT